MRVLEHPSVYRLWQMPFARAKFDPVLRHGNLRAAQRVLDVGCGPGTNAKYFEHTEYLGLDINPRYIDEAQRRYGDRFIVADVSRDALPDGRLFDFVLINSLLHHLPTDAVQRLLAHVANHIEPRGHVHILDLVMPTKQGIARYLARWDRGAFARSLDEWESLFREAFDSVLLQPYALPGAGPTLWNMVYFKGRPRQ